MTENPWDDRRIQKLRELWADSTLSAETIGKLIGLSKNAVVGKVHRLNLPPRPSPIIRGREPAPPTKRAGKVTLPGLAEAQALMPIKPAMPPRVRRTEVKPCCWPIGHPGKSGFHFCNSDALEKKPYCEDHAEIAYVRARNVEQDDA